MAEGGNVSSAIELLDITRVQALALVVRSEDGYISALLADLVMSRQRLASFEAGDGAQLRTLAGGNLTQRSIGENTQSLSYNVPTASASHF
jgi:hypothetical protein